MVDSGTKVSLISKSLLSNDILKTLNTYTGKIVAAEGSPLNCVGWLETEVVIADKKLKFEAIVVDNLQQTMLIGTNFFIENQCILDYSKLCFTVNGTTVPLLSMKQTKEAVYKTILDKTIKIPAHSVIEKVKIKCRHMRGNANKGTFTAFFEPNEKLLEQKHGVQSEALLVNVIKGKSQMRIINPSNQPITLYRNQVLGKICSLATETINLITKIDDEVILANSTEFDEDEVLFEKLKLQELTHLTSAELRQVKELVKRHKKVFAIDEKRIKPSKIPPLEIKLTTDMPIRVPARPIALSLKPEAEKLVKQLMDLDIIEHVTESTKYHSNAFIISKPKATGENSKYRLISDYRNINKYLCKPIQSLPDIDTVTSLWKGCRFWANLDLSLGYFQCVLSENSRDITTSSIPGVATFRYKRVPLGLSISSQHFQGSLEKTLLGLKNSKCVQYLDDLALAAKTFAELLDGLEAIFIALEKVGLVLKPEKSRLFQQEIEYLGHILSEKGLGMNPKKLEAIAKMSRPRNKTQIKSFVAMASYYRRFIPNFSEIIRPMNIILRGQTRFSWGNEQQAAFDKLREKIQQNPILKFPDMSKQFILKTDSSDFCTGAILSQESDDGFLHPVAFASRLLSPQQTRWSVFQKEFYAMKYYICEKFRVYLKHGKSFILLTDHKPLIHWRTSKLIDGSLWRWYTDLSMFDFEVIHIPGPKNISDCPSRLPRTNDKLFQSYLQAITENGKIKRKQFFENKEFENEDATQRQTPKNIGTQTENPESQTANNKIDKVSCQAIDTQLEPEISVEKWEIEFLDKTTLIEAQKQDPVLSVVRRWVEANKQPPLNNKTQKLSTELKNYRSSFSRLKIKDGVLLRSWEKQNLEMPEWLICLPEYYQETIIRLAHDIPSSGHFGQQKTLQRIRSRFYFPHCDLMVRLYVDNCQVCVLKKGKRKPIAPLNPFYGTHPNDVAQMDICGPMPKNKHGYKFILVILCKFTGWPEAVPMKETTAPKIARALLDNWISRWGLMNQLHSDRGPQFCSDVLKCVFTMLGLVYQSQTMAYNPKSDGGSEKLVATVKQLLTSYCRENPEDWPDMLQQLLLAHRTSISATTKYSPMFLMTGRSAKLPMDLVFDNYTQKLHGNRAEYAYELYKKLRKVYRHVDKTLQANRDMAKQYYDNRTSVKQYNLGDFVYLWRPKKKGSNVFTSNFYGPYEITKLCGDYRYKLDVGSSRIHNIVPHDLLRKAPKHAILQTREFDAVNIELDHMEEPELQNFEFEIEDTIPEPTTEYEPASNRRVIELENTNCQERLTRNRRVPDRYQAGFN